MKKFLSALIVCSILFISQGLFAANPTSNVSWDSYSVTIDGVVTPADSYEVVIVSATSNMNTAGTTALATATVTTTSISLFTLASGLPDGTYRIQVRAHVGSFVNSWSNPTGLSWTSLLPNLVINVQVNPV